MAFDAKQIEPAWLIEKLPSFELAHAARLDLARAGIGSQQIEQLVLSIPSEFRTRWDTFVAEARPGDSLWFFKSSHDSWATLSGCSGFAVVRDGIPISGLVTLRS